MQYIFTQKHCFKRLAYCILTNRSTKNPLQKSPSKEPFAKWGPASLKSSLKSCKETIHTGPSAKGPSLRGRPALSLFHSRKEPFTKRLSKKPSHDLKWSQILQMNDLKFYKFIEREGFEIKGFADDHQIYASFAPPYQYQFLVTKLNCIFASVDLWMSKFFLKLNPLKSQIIVFCNDALKRQLNINGFFLGNSCIRFCDTVRNLGFTLDSHLTLEQQVKECVSSVFASIKSIARIKHLLTRNEVTILVSSLILSKLDYCNSLYYDITCSLTKQLQYAQNCAARLIYNKRKYDHVTELLIELHWLPIKYRILYKIYLLTYKCIYPTSFAQPEE